MSDTPVTCGQCGTRKPLSEWGARCTEPGCALFNRGWDAGYAAGAVIGRELGRREAFEEAAKVAEGDEGEGDIDFIAFILRTRSKAVVP